MEITKLSSKGQIVIPEIIREDLEAGTPFIVSRHGELIILKPVEGLTLQEVKEAKELELIWKDIDEGRAVTMSKEDFLEEMAQW